MFMINGSWEVLDKSRINISRREKHLYLTRTTIIYSIIKDWEKAWQTIADEYFSHPEIVNKQLSTDIITFKMYSY